MPKKSSDPAPPLPGLTVDDISLMADSKTFQRGDRYWRDGAVGSIIDDRGRVMATVEGTRRYRVELMMRNGGLDFSCTCPVGDEGEFCKHCVATALACVNGDSPSSSRKRRASVISTTALAEGLARVAKEDLVNLLVQRAVKDESLRAAVGRLIDSASGRPVDTTPYRRMIDRVLRTGNRDYFESRDLADAMREVIDAIGEALTDPASAAAMIPLIEHAVVKSEKLLTLTDDSDGEISDAIHGMADLHAKACELARPDPSALAERLFVLARQGESEAFLDAYPRYADILGAVGRSRFREIAESEWKKVKGARSTSVFGFDLDRSTLTYVMESIGKKDRDTDFLVSVMKKDLTYPFRYVEIAQVLLDAGRADEALEWAEKGAGKFRANPDSRLTTLLVQEYARRGRTQAALDEAWNLFAAQPSVEAFRLLKKQAEILNVWKEWRAKAVGLLDDLSQKEGTARHGAFYPYVDTSTTLVEILLDDDDPDGAWRAAITHGCRNDLWLRLADARAAGHPEDALAIYRARIEEAASGVGRQGYERIVDLLGRMERIMLREGREEEFADEVRRLREMWKRRRTFVAMLDEKFPATGDKAAAEVPPPLPKRRRG